MKFKELAIGDKFEFDRSQWWSSSLASGPWVKLSARTYERIDDKMQCRVGSINVGVERVD
jgi:hypothetical protein